MVHTFYHLLVYLYLCLWSRNVAELLQILTLNSTDSTQLSARGKSAEQIVSPQLDPAGALTQRFHWWLSPAPHLLLLKSGPSHSLSAVCGVVIETIGSAAHVCVSVPLSLCHTFCVTDLQLPASIKLEIKNNPTHAAQMCSTQYIAVKADEHLDWVCLSHLVNFCHDKNGNCLCEWSRFFVLVRWTL